MRTGAEKGRRGRRVASIIRQVVSEELVTRLNDPRLAFVTVTEVDLAADLRVADVRVSVMGDSKQQEDCLRAIRHAHGRIQQKVAGALRVKFVPILKFHLDQSVKRSVSLSAIIARARAEDEANRAERIRRGVEPPGDLATPEESEPVPEDEDEPLDAMDDLDEDDGFQDDESDSGPAET
jgi:ribosome-binding factor A